MAVTSAGAPLRAGFVGGGFMATVHANAVRASRGRLVSLASSTPERAQAAAEGLGFESWSVSLEDLLSAELDVVHVVSPNATHAAIATAALQSGRHVVCEKPLATTVADARDLAALARSTGLVAAVPFIYRYHPLVREARARVARGDAGRLLTLQGSYLQDWLLTESDDNWRVDTALGGASRAFADIGSHLCDLVEFVTGDRITRLASLTRTFVADRANNRSVATEDAAGVVLETAGGAIGTLLVSQVAPGRKNRLTFEIAGSAESIQFDQEAPETLWIGRRTESSVIARDAANLSPDAARLSVVPSGHPMGYQDAFNGFVADVHSAIRGGQPEGLPTFEDGLRAALLTDAVLASAADGSWVDVRVNEEVQA
jgi:predicted dehydrogenase